MEQPAAPDDRPGSRWRGRPPRDVALPLAGAAALVLAFWLVLGLRSLLVLLLISFFLSFALEPPVNLLAARGWWRGLGTAAVFAALVVAVVLFVGALGSLLVAQVGDLVDAIPGYAQQVTGFVNDRFGTELSGAELADQLRGNQGVKDFVNGLAAGAVGLSTTLVGLVLQGLTVGLFTFYLVADGPRLRRTVCSVLPPGRQGVALRVWDLAIDSTGGYVYSRVLLAAVSAVATTLFLTLAGGALPARPRALGGAGLPVRPHRRHVSGRRPAGADRPARQLGQRPLGAGLHRRLPAVREHDPVAADHRPDHGPAPGEEDQMNREQRLEMLGRLAEVPSVELKMNIPADQRMAVSGLELDAMRGRLRRSSSSTPPT
jgi:hypothetical protein